MRRVVVTGGPGAGKTTLLAELAANGYATVSESAREIIAARVAQGLPPRPEQSIFAADILRLDEEKYRIAIHESGLVFYDRSAIEALGMVQDATALSEDELERKLIGYAYHHTVFVLPPWEAIYVNDAERDHTFSHAVHVHGQIVRWYQRCGYRLNEVPRIPVRQRAKHVLRAVANDA